MPLAKNVQIRQYAEREILQASTFLTQVSSPRAEEIHLPSPTIVQKYLTIIDLTSGKRIENTDQSAVVVALAERLKGIAQAFGNCEILAEQTGKKSDTEVAELYSWYVDHGQSLGSIRTDIIQVERVTPPCHIPWSGAAAPRNIPASIRTDVRAEIPRHPSTSRLVSVDDRTCF